MWYNLCQKVWNWREKEARRGEITRVQCIKCKRKDTIGEKVLEQKRSEILYLECRTGKKKLWWNQGVAVHPIEGKAQQGSAQTGVSKSIVKKENKQRDIRRMFKILRKVQLNTGVEKVDMHKGITVKVLLYSSTTEIFMNRKITARNKFKLQKLERLVVVSQMATY